MSFFLFTRNKKRIITKIYYTKKDPNSTIIYANRKILMKQFIKEQQIVYNHSNVFIPILAHAKPASHPACPAPITATS